MEGDVMFSQCVDVVIIGGGIMGLSTAYHLVKRGITNIAIIEKELSFGGHTTRRCAGGFRHQFSDPDNIELSKLSQSLIDEYRNNNGAEIGYNSCGYSFLLTERELSQYKKIVDLQLSHGINVTLLKQEDIKEFFPMLNMTDIAGATYSSNDGLLDVGDLINYYYREIKAAGAFLIGGAQVTAIKCERGRPEKVVTDRCEFATNIVVNAAGPWAGEIGEMTNTEIPIVSSLQQLLVLGNISWMPQKFPVAIIPSEGFGFHVEGDGIMSGLTRPCTNAGFEEKGVDRFWEIKHCKETINRIPSLKKSIITSRWYGYYEKTPDDNPIIGKVDDMENIFIVAGFSGHGVMHAPACGYIISSLIAKEEIAINVDAFALRRFENSKSICGEIMKI